MSPFGRIYSSPSDSDISIADIASRDPSARDPSEGECSGGKYRGLLGAGAIVVALSLASLNGRICEATQDGYEPPTRPNDGCGEVMNDKGDVFEWCVTRSVGTQYLKLVSTTVRARRNSPFGTQIIWNNDGRIEVWGLRVSDEGSSSWSHYYIKPDNDTKDKGHNNSQ